MLNSVVTELFPTITIGNSGYTELGSPFPGKSFLFSTVYIWTANTGAFSVANYGSIIYAIGSPGTIIRGLRVRCWYME